MPLSQELQYIYASAPDDLEYHQVLEVYHPYWGDSLSERVFYLTSSADPLENRPWPVRNADGSIQNEFDVENIRYEPVTWIPASLQLIEPQIDDKGQLDLDIVVGNFHPDIWRNIQALMPTTDTDLAAFEESNVPLEIAYSVYGSAPDRPPGLNPPLRLIVTAIEVSQQVIRATASRPDIVSIQFPRRVYTVLQFPGLRRT